MSKKCCPKCKTNEWKYDIFDGLWTWCEDCYYEAKKLGFYEKIKEAFELLK